MQLIRWLGGDVRAACDSLWFVIRQTLRPCNLQCYQITNRVFRFVILYLALETSKLVNSEEYSSTSFRTTAYEEGGYGLYSCLLQLIKCKYTSSDGLTVIRNRETANVNLCVH